MGTFPLPACLPARAFRGSVPGTATRGQQTHAATIRLRQSVLPQLCAAQHQAPGTVSEVRSVQSTLWGRGSRWTVELVKQNCVRSVTVMGGPRPRPRRLRLKACRVAWHVLVSTMRHGIYIYGNELRCSIERPWTEKDRSRNAVKTETACTALLQSLKCKAGSQTD